MAGEGLAPSATATTVRVRDGERMLTDGPFAETKEQLGGFYLLEAADLDEALEWAGEDPEPCASVEVRPVIDYEARGSEEHGPRGSARSPAEISEVVDRLFRRESGRAVATLIRVLGDFDLAEEAVQDAFVVALERWPRDGIPRQSRRLDHPGRPQRRDRPAASRADPGREARTLEALAGLEPRRRAGRRRATTTSPTTGCG